MRRREFIALVAGAVTACPMAGHTQQPARGRRIGVVMTLTKDNVEGQARLNALVQGLEALGWTSGHNMHLDARWAGDDLDRLRTHVADLANLKPDVIVAGGSRAMLLLQQQIRTIPIVFVAAAGTTEHGLVTNAARPAGNMTGYTTFDSFALVGKMLSGVKEVAPAVARVTRIMFRGHPSLPGYRQEFETAGRSLGVVTVATDATNAVELESIITGFAREPHGGLVMPADQFNVQHRDLIIALAARHRLPAIYAYRTHVEAGGLMSYGIDFSALYRASAGYVDRILKGEKPSDLPVQSPTKYQLTINLKTAKALGLAISPTLLARADEVIE
jgi:putative tryptophan/tyrosine transport system substrate-binding protein